MMFKVQKGFEERLVESTKVLSKYPDRIPIVCERWASSVSLPDVDRKKYLVPRELTVAQFLYVLRKRMSMPSTQAIFLSTESGQLPSSGQQLQHLYATCRDEDGFLYLRYSGENTFGRRGVLRGCG